MSSARLVSPRFYFDADILGLAKLVGQERADVTYPGDPGGRIKKQQRPPCVISDPGTLDPVWIPAVAAQGWLILKRDATIQTKRAEIDAVRNNGAKMVNLASAEATNTWTQLEILMTRWREIEALHAQLGPFIVITSRTGKIAQSTSPNPRQFMRLASHLIC